ncbi:MAG: hypothetical protein DRI95_09075 [Bacteroidetes bacterium]|nr:MAG: hypothetical protein DRI95_09075 [Bacteroidota bacterium]
MEVKRLIIHTKLLLNDIIDINKASFFEIRADNEEVTNLWREYGRLRNILIQSHPVLFNTLPEQFVPEPYMVTEERFHDIGTLVFKPEHFASLRLEVERILEALKSLSKKEKRNSANYTRKKMRA